MSERQISRREVLATGALVLGAGCYRNTTKAGKTAAVSIRKVNSYSGEIAREVISILTEHKLAVADKRVVLKPNLVEFDPGAPINTHPAFVSGVAEAFEALGAAEVRIAEGPGHRRSTLDMAEAAGFFEAIRGFEKRFTDLNLDDVTERVLRNPVSKLKSLYLPQTVLEADLLVSLPKMKTHHWAGATLSMKNLFGIVPGAVYGWPKNVLHWAGIDQCIIDLNNNIPAHFAIVDGIVGMEGNGPIQGIARSIGLIVAGCDLAAVDQTCCQLMGINPERVDYLKPFQSNQIAQIGEQLAPLRSTFQLPPGLEHLRMA